MTLHEHLKEQAYLYLIDALDRAQWHVPTACQLAHVSQATLYRKIGKVQCEGKLRRIVAGSIPAPPSKRKPPPRRLPRPFKVLDLLAFFNTPCSVKGGIAFWCQYESDLRSLLAQAHAGYLALAKLHHPDNGGDPRKMAQINDAWGRLEAMFRHRGLTR